VLSDDSKYQPKAEPANDPKGSKVALDMPVWCSNVDRVLIALSKSQKERLGRVKKMHKVLEGVQESLAKEEGRYKS
jgi:hypothetical protein